MLCMKTRLCVRAERFRTSSLVHGSQSELQGGRERSGEEEECLKWLGGMEEAGRSRKRPRAAGIFRMPTRNTVGHRNVYRRYGGQVARVPRQVQSMLDLRLRR